MGFMLKKLILAYFRQNYINHFSPVCVNLKRFNTGEMIVVRFLVSENESFFLRLCDFKTLLLCFCTIVFAV